MKYCPRCKEDKPLVTFKRRRGGEYQAYCIVCQSAYGKEHYNANKPKYVEQALKITRAKVAAFQQLKEASPCTDCGQFFPYYVMQFDHLDGSNKKFNLSSHANKSLRKVLEELSKCELVCANCHAIRSHNRMQ